jgi:hypothetical protein
MRQRQEEDRERPLDHWREQLGICELGDHGSDYQAKTARTMDQTRFRSRPAPADRRHNP